MSDPDGGAEPDPVDVSWIGGLFEYRRPIATGRTSRVIEALNVETQERVAIKLIPSAISGQADFAEAFKKQSRRIERARHPALVSYRVCGFKPADRSAYIVMDFVDGPRLIDVMATFGPTEPELIAFTRRLASGLQILHENGMVHGRLTDQRVLLERGRVERARIVGLPLTADEPLLADGFAFLAPEQLGDFNRKIGPWTDIYSLGLVVAGFARGARVNMGRTLVEALEGRRQLIDLSEMTQSFRSIIESMLEPDPGRRIGAASDIIDRIDRSFQRQAQFAPPITNFESVHGTDEDNYLDTERHVYLGPESSVIAARRSATMIPPPSAPSSIIKGIFARKRNSLPKGSKPGSNYTVWFGTNRRPYKDDDSAKGYGMQRAETLSFGRCTVFIPTSHRIGSTGSGWFKRLITRVDDRLVLNAINPLAESQFWEDARSTLAKLPMDARTAVVFIHGYNVSFEQAAIRTAQIGHDLSINGIMAFFSWPSRGYLGGYIQDGESIQASEIPIADFLAAFARQSGAERIHVIAHSMGNRGFLRAVDRLSRMPDVDASKFDQFILAAPDVDVGVFKQLAASYHGLASRTTLYVSAKDRAVGLSKWIHDFDRVGYIPPVTIIPDIDTINVANIDLTVLGHGFVAEARDVLQDMHRLLNSGLAPAQRFGVKPKQDKSGQYYWEIGA